MQLSPEIVWRASTKELGKLLNTGELAAKPKIARFYVPSFVYYKTIYYSSPSNRFPSLSVTGTTCALNCKHCGGKVLETMYPAKTPNELSELAIKLKKHGALGCLISGGCLSNGSIPLKRFIPAIKKIKQELGLTVFIHTGIIDASTAMALKNAGVDAALIDIIGSDETIKKIGDSNLTVKDYAGSLNVLHKASLNFVPHVIVGLHDGKLKGELDALKIVAPLKPSAVVVIAFVPIPGTAMAKVESPQPADIARVIAVTRLMLPRTPIVLGCVRPKGKHRTKTDILALKAGVDAIAFPTEESVKYAETEGYSFSFSSFCCAQIYFDATFRRSSK